MKTLTIKDAAELAGVNENTARYYRDKFDDYIPAIGEGRNRRYAQETVQILRAIKDYYDQGMDADEIRHNLNEAFGMPVVTTTTALQKPKKELAGLVGEHLVGVMEEVIERAVAKALVKIREDDHQEINKIINESLERQAALYVEEIKKLNNEVQELKDYVAQAEATQDTRDSELMRRIREIQQSQLEVNKKPWWKIWG